MIDGVGGDKKRVEITSSRVCGIRPDRPDIGNAVSGWMVATIRVVILAAIFSLLERAM